MRTYKLANPKVADSISNAIYNVAGYTDCLETHDCTDTCEKITQEDVVKIRTELSYIDTLVSLLFN